MEENEATIPYWNRKHLSPPTMISKSLISVQPATTSRKLFTLLNNIVEALKELSGLDTEAALLSRLIFRMKTMFRHDKSLKYMQMMNRCLRNLLHVNLLPTIEELEVCTYGENGPTTEMLQWAKLCLQRQVASLNNLIEICYSAVPSFNNKLVTGHFWNISMIVLGVISRILLISRHLCFKSCDWYQKLDTFIENTAPTKENSMLSSHEFPDDLSAWLSHPSHLHKKPQQLVVAYHAIPKSSSSSDEMKEWFGYKQDLGEKINRSHFHRSKKLKTRCRNDRNKKNKKELKKAKNKDDGIKNLCHHLTLHNVFGKMKGNLDELDKRNKKIKRKLNTDTKDLDPSDLTNNLLYHRIADMEKECVVLNIQNEIFEKFLKRTNLPLYLEKFESQRPLVHSDIVGQSEEEKAKTRKEMQKMREIDKSSIMLTSKEILLKMQESEDGQYDQEICKEGSTIMKFLAKIAEQELAELYRIAKKKGLNNDQSAFEIQAQKGSLQQKINYLQNSLSNYDAHFGKILEIKKVLPGYMISPEVAYKYFREQAKRIDTASRVYTLATSKVNRQLMDIHDWRSSCSHITAADLDVLQVECVQLQKVLEKNEKEFKNLRAVLGSSVK